MDNDSVEAILQRIDQRRNALKRRNRSGRFSNRAISRAAGASPDYLRVLRRQYKAGRQKSITGRILVGLARALQTTPEWLEDGSGDEEATYQTVMRPVGGRQTESRIIWSVHREGHTYFVNEQLDDKIACWGPLPSETLAYALIEDRKATLKGTLTGRERPRASVRP